MLFYNCFSLCDANSETSLQRASQAALRSITIFRRARTRDPILACFAFYYDYYMQMQTKLSLIY